MRKLLRLVLIVITLVASSQIAAAESPTVSDSTSAGKWSGVYVGGHLGYMSARTTWADQDRSFFSSVANAEDSAASKGPMWGGQIGLNMQSGAWVFGPEISVSKTDVDDTFPSKFFPTMDVWTTDLKWTGTLTGRVGYAFGNFLPYVKGGFATARLRSKMIWVASNVSTEDTKQLYGWTIGGGFEYLIGRHWTTGIEFDYMKFQKKTYDTPLMFNSTEVDRESWKIGLSTISCMARLNYKF